MDEGRGIWGFGDLGIWGFGDLGIWGLNSFSFVQLQLDIYWH
jgi:hypothetical protein